jgi:transcriptional regulator with XRE-family HTH domain
MEKIEKIDFFFARVCNDRMKAMTTGLPGGQGGADLKQQFRDLLRASGWSQAEAARQLAMTPSALSQIVRRNSPVRPSPVTLRLFRLLLWREKPEVLRQPAPRNAPHASEAWEHDVVRDLRAIPPKARHSFLRQLRALIAAAQKKGGRAIASPVQGSRGGA